MNLHDGELAFRLEARLPYSPSRLIPGSGRLAFATESIKKLPLAIRATLPPSLLFFRAPFTSHRSPVSERLEQAKDNYSGLQKIFFKKRNFLIPL